MVADVLVVAGTHGNEVNAPWLVDQWNLNPDLIARHGINVQTVIGNTKAFVENRRYLNRDLNRSFQDALLTSDDCAAWEPLHEGPFDRQGCLLRAWGQAKKGTRAPTDAQNSPNCDAVTKGSFVTDIL